MGIGQYQILSTFARESDSITDVICQESSAAFAEPYYFGNSAISSTSESTLYASTHSSHRCSSFALVSKQPSVQSFRIHLSDPSFSAKSASVSNKAPDLSNVLEEYHEFSDVFSKAKANTLVLHHPYDLKINLEKGASPPINLMYSLSQSELTTLWEFINKHLQIRFICPTNSPYGAPVLFVQKKNGSL